MSEGNDVATGVSVCGDFFVGGEGDAGGGWDHEDGVGDFVEFVDSGGVDEVEVVAGVEDGGDEVGGDALVHLVGDGVVAGREGGLGVVFGEQDGDVVGGFALAEEPAHALKVARDVGHYCEPGIVAVEDGGGVEGLAWLAGGGWGVRPAVADDLVDAEEEHAVGFDLHFEGRGAESWRVEPGEGFCGYDVAMVEVGGGSGPAGVRKLATLGAFALGEVGDGLVGEGDGGLAVGLGAEWVWWDSAKRVSGAR